ncbi:hypothetical protein D3C81_900470 [compost metagenome]
MSRKSIAAQVLLPGKLIDMRKGQEKFQRIKALTNQVEQSRGQCPYTIENMDTLLTMGLAACVQGNIPMMIFWRNAAAQIEDDLNYWIRHEIRCQHQLNRISRIAKRYGDYYQALGNEIKQLQHTIKCG